LKVVAALKESLLSEAKLDAFLADANGVVEAEVHDKKGASGLVVKTGYGAVTKVGPSVVPNAIAALAPDFVERLEPFWQEYTANGGGTFAEALVARGDAVSEALLSVTDARIEGSSKTAIKKVYSSLRGSAKDNVIAALPRLGELIQKHA
jgi:hypothetical protein